MHLYAFTNANWSFLKVELWQEVNTFKGHTTFSNAKIFKRETLDVNSFSRKLQSYAQCLRAKLFPPSDLRPLRGDTPGSRRTLNSGVLRDKVFEKGHASSLQIGILIRQTDVIWISQDTLSSQNSTRRLLLTAFNCCPGFTSTLNRQLQHHG